MLTHCAICGEEMQYNADAFRSGPTGEPICSKCLEDEQKVTTDD